MTFLKKKSIFLRGTFLQSTTGVVKAILRSYLPEAATLICTEENLDKAAEAANQTHMPITQDTGNQPVYAFMVQLKY